MERYAEIVAEQGFKTELKMVVYSPFLDKITG